MTFLSKKEEERAHDHYNAFCSFAEEWLVAGEGAVQKLMVISHFRQHDEKYRYSSEITDYEIEDCLKKWNQEHAKATVDTMGMYLGLSIKTTPKEPKEPTEKEKKIQILTLLKECKQKGVKPPLKAVQAAISLGIIKVPPRQEPHADASKKLDESKKPASAVNNHNEKSGKTTEKEHKHKNDKASKDKESDDFEFHWEDYHGDFNWADYQQQFAVDPSSSSKGKDRNSRSKSPTRKTEHKSSRSKSPSRNTGRSKSPTRTKSKSSSRSKSRSKSPTKGSKDSNRNERLSRRARRKSGSKESSDVKSSSSKDEAPAYRSQKTC